MQTPRYEYSRAAIAARIEGLTNLQFLIQPNEWSRVGEKENCLVNLRGTMSVIG